MIDTSRRLQKVSLVITVGVAAAMIVLLSYELAGLYWDQSAAPSSGFGQKQTAASYDLQFSFYEKPVDMPTFEFSDDTGRPRSLAEFRGRPILLNVWATWCVPCRKEMPSLDRLQAKFDPSEFLVLTLSVDRQGVPAAMEFYKELGLKSLAIYSDKSGKILDLLRAPGLPTTVFINRDGQEIGRKIGPAEWDSPEVLGILRKHLDLPD